MSRIIPLVQIEKIALHGYGLGYAEGKAVFVPYTMPGDCVDVKVLLEKKDVIFGTVAEFIEAAEESSQPDCEAFSGEDACGGCDWLMAPYQVQTGWKTELIRQVFEPLKLSSKVSDIVPSPEPRYYRNKSFVPAAQDEEGLYFGMFARYSHTVIEHNRCKLQPEIMDAILAEIADFANKVNLDPYDEYTQKGVLRHVGIRINKPQTEILLILVTKGSKFPFTQQFIRSLTTRFPQITGIVQNINRSNGNVILGEEDKLLFGSPYLNDELNGIRFRLHYKSFFQINSYIAELINKHLRQQVKQTDVLLDAFCGIGSMGLTLADLVREVHGVDEIAEAITDAEFNQKQNNITNAYWHLGKVEEILPGLMYRHQFSCIILDPPRKGVEVSVLEAIIMQKIPRIIYVSCNPMTLARDIRTLREGGYSVENITPFDMFPQTWHIETVVQLNLN